MLSAYPACFFKEGSGYSVIFPDLNHLATCGDTLEDAFAAAVDCLAGYLFEAKKTVMRSQLQALYNPCHWKMLRKI